MTWIAWWSMYLYSCLRKRRDHSLLQRTLDRKKTSKLNCIWSYGECRLNRLNWQSQMVFEGAIQEMEESTPNSKKQATNPNTKLLHLYRNVLQVIAPQSTQVATVQHPYSSMCPWPSRQYVENSAKLLKLPMNLCLQATYKPEILTTKS